MVGNHDLTLDTSFFEKMSQGDGVVSHRKWPEPQSAEENRKLFTESKSITYLENEAATIYLNAKGGPRTCFKVYGSPCTPNNRNWAFGYKPGTAQGLWDAIPSDTDIVVTHTPPLGHRDKAVDDERTGCGELVKVLRRVRPLLSVFGHIHEARGVERVMWNLAGSGDECLTESVEGWEDPGQGKKQSMVNLSGKGGRPLDNCSGLTRQTCNPELSSQAPTKRLGNDHGHGVLEAFDIKSPSFLEGVAGEATMIRGQKVVVGGAIECRQSLPVPDVEDGERRETVMINAAFVGPHHLKTMFNKPLVVDVDLPVWAGDEDDVL